jgi:hypothetical protein
VETTLEGCYCWNVRSERLDMTYFFFIRTHKEPTARRQRRLRAARELLFFVSETLTMRPGTMRPGVRKHSKNSLRWGGDPRCCIACGRNFMVLSVNHRLLDEREEWKNLKNCRHARSFMVKAEDIESIYFHKRPWLWSCFYRASKQIVSTTGGKIHSR